MERAGAGGLNDTVCLSQQPGGQMKGSVIWFIQQHRRSKNKTVIMICSRYESEGNAAAVEKAITGRRLDQRRRNDLNKMNGSVYVLCNMVTEAERVRNQIQRQGTGGGGGGGGAADRKETD